MRCIPSTLYQGCYLNPAWCDRNPFQDGRMRSTARQVEDEALLKARLYSCRRFLYDFAYFIFSNTLQNLPCIFLAAGQRFGEL